MESERGPRRDAATALTYGPSNQSIADGPRIRTTTVEHRFRQSQQGPAVRSGGGLRDDSRGDRLFRHRRSRPAGGTVRRLSAVDHHRLCGWSIGNDHVRHGLHSSFDDRPGGHRRSPRSWSWTDLSPGGWRGDRHPADPLGVDATGLSDALRATGCVERFRQRVGPADLPGAIAGIRHQSAFRRNASSGSWPCSDPQWCATADHLGNGSAGSGDHLWTAPSDAAGAVSTGGHRGVDSHFHGLQLAGKLRYSDSERPR